MIAAEQNMTLNEDPKPPVQLSRINRVKHENESLKQKLTVMENKMLEHNIVITGISEEKCEDPQPRRKKINAELANLLNGTSHEEKLSSAKKLDIMHTEHIGCFNPQKGRPISISIVLANNKKLSKGIFVDKQYSDETEHERRRLRPVLSAARQLEEYRDKSRFNVQKS